MLPQFISIYAFISIPLADYVNEIDKLCEKYIISRMV